MSGKKALYFSHDYSARNDIKMIRLARDLGQEGIGIFWCIVEMLHESGGYLDVADIGLIAYQLHVKEALLAKVINEYGLFKTVDGHFYSQRALSNMAKMTRLSSIRSEAGSKGAKITNARRASPSNTPVGKPTAIADLLPQQIPGNCRSDDAEINKEKETKINISINGLDAQQRENILEIFVLEKGWTMKTAEQELVRMESYYAPTGWTRKGDNKPVLDKVALARTWSPSNDKPVQMLFPDSTIKEWVRSVYYNAKEQGDELFSCILRELTSVTKNKGEEKDQYVFVCTERTRICVERNLVKTTAFKLLYRQPNFMSRR